MAAIGSEALSGSLMILGNPGVGKSLISNVIHGIDVFDSRVSVEAVTKIGESVLISRINSGGLSESLRIHNLPGLIESSEEKTNANKIHIENAILANPVAIVGFVFSAAKGGRIAAEDIVAFRALKDAYEFNNDSFFLIVNQVPAEDPLYEGKVMTFFQEVFQLYVPIVFIKEADPEKWEIGHSFRQSVRIQIMGTIASRRMMYQSKKKDIKLPHDQIANLCNKIEGEKMQFYAEEKKLRESFEKEEKLFKLQMKKNEEMIAILIKEKKNSFFLDLSKFVLELLPIIFNKSKT